MNGYLHSYETAHGQFPVNSFASISIAAGSLSIRQTTSGGVALLPYIDQAPLFNQWNSKVAQWDTASSNNGNVLATSLSIWFCPSSVGGNGGTPVTAGGTPQTGSRVIAIYIPSGTQLQPGFPPTSVAISWRGGSADYIWVDGIQKAYLSGFGGSGSHGGMFYDVGAAGADPTTQAVLQAGVGGQSVTSRIADVTDGLSNTFALYEKAGRNNVWVNGRLQTIASTIPSIGGASGQVVFNSMLGGGDWGDFLNYETAAGVLSAGYDAGNGGPCVVNCSNANESGIYAFHVGGGHALLGDGAVNFISASVDSGVFAAACTKAGGESKNLGF